MNGQIKFKLYHSEQYLTNNGRPNQVHELDFRLEEHCRDLGFSIGVRNITDMDETDFAEARNNTFGASDSSVLLGVPYSSKYVEAKTPEKLVQEKVENYWDESIGKKGSVRKGKELEDFIIKKFEKILNAFILKPSHMYVNGKGLATNFDGVIFENVTDPEDPSIVIKHAPIPFEIKVCTVWANKNYDWDKAVSEFATKVELLIPRDVPLKRSTSIDEYIELKAKHFGIPKYYYTQLQQQMLFLGADHGHLGVMKDDDWTLYIFTIPRDDYVISQLENTSFHYYVMLCKKKGLSMPGKE